MKSAGRTRGSLHAARVCAELGMRIVAISDVTGGVHDPDGLDVAALARLIEGALKKSRINGRNRLQSFGCHTRAECNAVLLGNTDVKGSGRKLFHYFVDTGAFWHCRSDSDDLLILFHQIDHRAGKNAGVGRCL